MSSLKQTLMRYLLLIIVLLFSVTLNCFSQKKSPFEKFGKVSLADLQKKVYKIDPAADAIVLSDIASVRFEGNSKGWFSLITNRHKVVHILNKNGYNEASVQIPLYVSGNDEEKVTALKAITYNLEDGVITQTKLDKSNQFFEVSSKHQKILKFTMPQVKEGSIIEYEYEQKSDFISVLNPWYFQSLTTPVLWSEFTFSLPQFFQYNIEYIGFQKFSYKDQNPKTGKYYIVGSSNSYSLTESSMYSPQYKGTINTTVTDYRWVIKDVPKLKTETFTSSIRNYISRMEFQLASQTSPFEIKDYSITWVDVTKELLANENFGLKLNANNSWMSDEVKPLYDGLVDKSQKAKKIFEYVRDNFKCDGRHGIFMDQTLKNVFKSRQGSVADINLLLTAMLKYAGLEAYPVLISTRSHGLASETSPMLGSMDYVVVQIADGEKAFYLDATQPRLGFNKLPLFCQNGFAMIVNKAADPVYFNADDIKEIKRTTVFINNMEDGKWAGALTQNIGDNESFEIREEIKKANVESFFKDVRKNYESIATLSNEVIDSLKNFESPVTIKYNLNFTNNNQDILYVNPTFSQGYTKNPFASAERNYPVEMPYAQDEVIHVTMEVPNGYVVDEMPKQTILKFDEEGKSFFEYRITQSKNIISFFNRIKLDKAFFLPEDYSSLREFFNFIVKKQSEQIVFKKIK